MEKLNLITDGSKLQKGDVLMIVGPSSDLTKEEFDLLQAFLKNHGKLVMFFDPSVREDLTYFKALLDYYMIKVGSDVVYEQDSSMRTELSGVELVPHLSTPLSREPSTYMCMRRSAWNIILPQTRA